MAEKTKRVNMDLPDELCNLLTIQAAKETYETGVKVYQREIVIKAIEQYLAKSN